MAEKAAMPNEVLLPGQHYNSWSYIAKAHEGETADIVSDPKFWVHMSKRIRPLDMIEVLSDDLSWELRFRVVRAYDGGLVLRETFRWQAGADDFKAAVTAAVPVVEWGGPQHKFRVNSEGTILKHGFATKGEAEDWLAARVSGRPERRAA